VKGLDTNVLVRYLTQDDPRQAATATRAIEAAASAGETLLIQPLVLCELVWVLESAYRFGKDEILATLEQILRTAQFEVAEKDTVWQALGDYRRGRGDFADYCLGRANHRAGAETTLSFDKALRDSDHFEVLGA
jgi:predicted nucleic-acid-binding protein